MSVLTGCTGRAGRCSMTCPNAGGDAGSRTHRMSQPDAAATSCTVGLGRTKVIEIARDAFARTLIPEIAIHTTSEQSMTAPPCRATYRLTMPRSQLRGRR